MLDKLLGEEWYKILESEFYKDYMINLNSFLHKRRREVIVYPKSEDTFSAYRETPYSKVKICIIGQDPYIREGQAHGLAFSTLDSSYTPSLKKIEEIIRKEIYPNVDYTWDNNLIRWSKQGIFLLNKVLTVDAGNSNSHKDKGWEKFTLQTVKELDKKGIIFLLWGKEAQEFKSFINNSIIIECEHPVAASYQGRQWNNNNCFSKVNQILKEEIKW